jgi:hypothetical protein
MPLLNPFFTLLTTKEIHMKNHTRFVFTCLTVFTVLAYSAMQTVPALADDGVPPQDAGASDSQPEETTAPEEVISQLPEGTDVVVVGEAGDTLPLATQAAADGFVEGDPMWCPAGVAPKENTNGCSPSFTDFGFDGDLPTNSLLGWLNTNDPKKAGTIWVANDYDSSTESNAVITIDGNNFDFMDAYALTVQGGWVYNITGSKALFTADPYSYFTDSTFFVSTWNNAVTLNNIVMDGVEINTAGFNQTLYVSTTGNIVLNNVIVRDSDNIDDSDPDYVFNGAILDNTAGTGTVTINNSEFLNNEGAGLYVYSNGAITTNNLVANSNGDYGAYLDNSFAQGKAVTLKGFKQFNNNGENAGAYGDGLMVISAGTITLSNVVANSNFGNGIYLNNTISTAKLGITLGGTNFMMNNGGDGAVLYSYGAITASNLNASGNDGYGAVLDNCDYDGVSNCLVTVAKTVKLTGVNTFTDNGSTNEGGLLISSLGAITVSNLIASDNVGDGADIINEYTSFSGVNSSGTFTLTGYGIFQNNGGNGLEAHSYGNIVLTNIDASYNGVDGMYLTAFKATGGSGITLNGVNSFYDNTEDGLDVTAFGVVTLNNVNASSNGNIGAHIDNTFDALKPYNVTLKGTNTFNNNGDNGVTDYEGLVIYSHGAILVTNLTASGNTLDGVVLDNCIWLGSFCEANMPKAVTVNGYSVTNNNTGGSGLYVDATGVVTLNNVFAQGNDEQGTYIINQADPTKGQNVMLKGSNTFIDNGDNGLEIESYGAITINNLSAFENGDAGASLYNTGGTSLKNITLTGVNTFVGNYTNGLEFIASGSAIFSRIYADNNGWDVDPGDGVTGSAGGSIMLSCLMTVNHTDGAGYTLASSGGAITIKGLYSAGNVNLDTALTTGLVTIVLPCALP